MSCYILENSHLLYVNVLEQTKNVVLVFFNGNDQEKKGTLLNDMRYLDEDYIFLILAARF